MPEKRYFPASVDHNRWLRSSPVEVGGAEIGRINARQSEDGRIEFAFTPTDRERILTDARYFPTDARPNRWLRSTEITISTGPIPFIAVSAGGFHTCGLRQSGTIECWGNNTHGQTDAPAGTFTAVMADYTHNCAIRDTGEVKCWGDHYVVTDPGDDGRELQTIETGLTDAPDGSYTAVDMGGRYHTCAIRTGSGEIECWGLSEVVYGIYTDTGGTAVVSFEYGLTDAPEGSFTAVSAGSSHTCAIAETFATTDGATDTGEIECWGVSEGDQHYYGQTDAPAGRFRAISAGSWHTCAIRTSGEIACWGDNNDGLTDAPAGSFTVISISDQDHICGLRTNGAITCWGANHYGKSDAPEGSFTTVSAGNFHTCAIRDTGAITCWGHNNDGQSHPSTD